MYCLGWILIEGRVGLSNRSLSLVEVEILLSYQSTSGCNGCTFARVWIQWMRLFKLLSSNISWRCYLWINISSSVEKWAFLDPRTRCRSNINQFSRRTSDLRGIPFRRGRASMVGKEFVWPQLWWHSKVWFNHVEQIVGLVRFFYLENFLENVLCLGFLPIWMEIKLETLGSWCYGLWMYSRSFEVVREGSIPSGGEPLGIRIWGQENSWFFFFIISRESKIKDLGYISRDPTHIDLRLGIIVDGWQNHG